MSRAFAPRGTQLQRGTGALPGTGFTTVAEVISIDRSGSKADLADVTNMDSPSSEREFLPTLIDEGEFTFEVNFIPGEATQTVVDSDFRTQQKSPWQVVLPNALGTWGPFNAYVVGGDFKLPIDKQGTRTLKLKVTGAPSATI